MNDIDELFAEIRRSEPHLVDHGFTTAVLARLPRNRELPIWLKNLILVGAPALASGICAAVLPLGKLVPLVLAASLNLPVLFMGMAMVYAFACMVAWVGQRDAF